MRKLAWLMAVLTLLTALAACGKKKTNPQTTNPEGETSVTDPGTVSDGAVKVKRNDNGSLTITVELSKNALTDVSVLVAKDRQTAAQLVANADAVLALDQITLDADGKGSVTLMPSEIVDCFVSINGKNIVEVKG